jgi:hypothetical protein
VNHLLEQFAVHKFQIEELDKEKYVVVLALRSTSFVGAFINSERRDYRQKPELDPCYVILPQSHHLFLKYDSIFSVDKNSVDEYDLYKVQGETYQGIIHVDFQESVRQSIAKCPSIRPAFRNEFLQQ